MKASITRDNPAKNQKKLSSRPAVRLWAVLLWLAVWQAAAMLLGQELFLVSPVKVLMRLWELVRTGDFWKRALASSGNIMGGLLLGALLGVALGALSAVSRFVKQLLAPLIAVIRAIPVASFIILAVVWLGPKHLGCFISLLICLPVFYTNTVTGIASADRKLKEMAEVFRFFPMKKLRVIYLPALLPYFKSACDVAVGLAWKSGTAAEVIAIPAGSIGEKLYRAKIYYETGDMLAWTLTIVLLSGAFALLIKKLTSLAAGKLGAEAEK